MKKFTSLFFVVFLFCFNVFCDDGGTRYPEDWTYGNIYVKEPNDKISLEREFMYVNQQDNEVTAIFDFKNTVNEKVVVPCAFPVIVTVPFVVKEDGSILTRVFYNIESSRLPWKIILPPSKDVSDCKEEIFALDRKLTVMPIAEYVEKIKKCSSEKSEYAPCLIEQDGKNVAVKTVGIETSVKKSDEYTSNEGDFYELNIVIHFFHELVFKPLSSSKLTVSYKTSTLKRSYKRDEYEVSYDISTGGTWKGAIKKFMLLTDSRFYGTESEFDHSYLGDFSGYEDGDGGLVLYSAENYKPYEDEIFKFSVRRIYDEGGCFFCYDRETGEQPFVKNIKSSSALGGSYSIAKNDLDFSSKDEDLVSSTYGAYTSFDGMLNNGWVEGVKGDGIGEWIEFTLTSYAIGPFATNGLRRFSGHKKGISMYDSKYEPDEGYYLYTKYGPAGKIWSSNNRVKTMLLSDSNGKKIATLSFADFFPEICSEGLTYWSNLNAVKNPVLLDKGTYRMTLESVYKGDKWDDTVLGEVWFIPVSDKVAKILSEDKDGFFTVPLTKIIQNDVSKREERMEMVNKARNERFYGED